MVAWTTSAQRRRGGVVPAVLVSFVNSVSQDHEFMAVCTNSTCEYMDGCEWREKKATEATEKLEARKAVKGLGQ